MTRGAAPRAWIAVWLLFALAILFGLTALAADDPALRRSLAGWGCLFLGGMSLGLAMIGIRSGRVRVQSAIVHRADHPRFFWFNIWLFVVAGAVLLASAARLWFF